MTSFEEILFKYKNSYYNFPKPLKIFLGSIYGKLPLSARFGKNFSLHTQVLKQFEEADEQFKLDYMYNKTLETLIFAQNNIPYYKNLFLKNNLSYKDFKSIDDIKLFPILKKDDIKRHINTMYIDKIEKPIAYYSGGSLSTPTKYFLPSSSRAKEKAYNNYIFSKLNYHYQDKTILLKGREVSQPKKNIFWDFEPIDNYFVISNNFINADVFPLIYQKIQEFKPKFFFGYPSAVLSFIKQCRKYKLKKININGVILASETIYHNELIEIQNFFTVDVLTHYGHTERNVIAYRINQNKYHFLNSYGLVRINNDEIITTTFDNFVMPFINYHTGDNASGEVSYYRNTDIAKQVYNIEGRTQDYLVTKDKRLVSITTMCGGQYLPLDQMNNIQYIQDSYGKVTVLVEGEKTINIEDIKRGMCKLVRDGIDFDIKLVDKIEKTSRGKRVICKQSLNIEKIRRSRNS